MSTNLEYRAWKRLRKSGRPAKLNERKGDRDLEREIKNNGDIFLLEEHENFVAAVTKWEMLASTNARRKWAALNENTYDISSIKRFLEVSRCSRAKQRQRNVLKKCAARAKLLLLIRPFLVFSTFSGVAFAAFHHTILYFVWTNYKYHRELPF